MLKNYQPEWDPTVCTQYSLENREDRLTTKFINRLNVILPEIKPNKKVIDIGCNTGWNSFELNRIGCNVLGIERRVELVETANNILKKYKLDSNTISFKRDNIINYFDKNQDTYYDYCVCFMVVHHFFANKAGEKRREALRRFKETSHVEIPRFSLKKEGIKLLKQIQSKCKSTFFQVRLIDGQSISSDDYKGDQLVNYLIDEIGFKSYKILRSNTNNYFRAPNLVYMFNN